MTIFDAIQAALAGECADPYETAQRLEQRLHKADYAVLPVPESHGSHLVEAGATYELLLTGLSPVEAADALRALERMRGLQ